MKNEYGAPIGKNGYAPSILQDDLSCCYLCGRSNCKLDRHEVYPAHNRQHSKRLGLWVMLCHDSCHLGSYGVHLNYEKGLQLKQDAQKKAMRYYNWTTDDFIEEFGKNYI